MALKEPETFDLKGWDEFYENALFYHNATRPDEQLVSHKIDTFRRFMSDNAIKYLCGLVRAHPRFDTVQGWDQWGADVAEVLSVREIWPYTGNKPVKAKSADELIAKYAKGKLSISKLWQGLDELVSRREISSVAQRVSFWSVLQKENQARLRARCAAVDPEHAVWEKANSVAAKLAEQELSRTLGLLTVDDITASGWTRLKLVTFVTAVILVAQWFGLTYLPLDTKFDIILCFIRTLGAVFGVIGFIKHSAALRRLVAKRQELSYVQT